MRIREKGKNECGGEAPWVEVNGGLILNYKKNRKAMPKKNIINININKYLLLPLWLFHWIFLSWWISCPVSKYQKVREKAEYLICSLQVILTSHQHQKNLNLRICFVVEFWNLNLKSKRVHLPRSCQKKPVYRPLEEKWRTKRLSCLLSHRKQKESHREVKRQKEAAIRLKG